MMEIWSKTSSYFAVFGAITAGCIALRLLLSVWTGLKAFVLAKPLHLTANLKGMGSWAVVTGSTDGIGKAYAHELARMGIDIVLISRTKEKLDNVASEIESKHHVKTKCIVINFTGGPEIYDKIRKELTGLEIGVLVNNVGVSYPYPKFFLEVNDDQLLRDIVNINVNSVVHMTNIVLPQMVERRKGVIINISSAAGDRPTPLLSAYSGSKAFVDFFTRSLAAEYKSRGIIVQCVLPYFVTTNLSKIRRQTFMTPGPQTYARQALGTVGVLPRTFGCLAHSIQGWVVNLLPGKIYMNVTLSSMLAVRKKKIKRDQMKKE